MGTTKRRVLDASAPPPRSPKKLATKRQKKPTKAPTTTTKKDTTWTTTTQQLDAQSLRPLLCVEKTKAEPWIRRGRYWQGMSGKSSRTVSFGCVLVLLRCRLASSWCFLSLRLASFGCFLSPWASISSPCGAMSLPPLRSDIVCAAVLCAHLVFTFVVLHLDAASGLCIWAI